MGKLKEILQNRDLARRFYLLVLAAISMIAVTLAWFFNGIRGETDSLNFGSVEAIDFQISLDGTNFLNKVTLDYPENLIFEPISGNPLTGKMYLPMLDTASNDASQVEDWAVIEYEEGAEKNCFHTFTVYFRSDTPGYATVQCMNIVPSASPEMRQGVNYTDKAGETVASAGTSEVVRPIRSNAIYELILGNPVITKDYIVGSARVALKNLADEVNTGVMDKAIFIPNDTYHLNFALDGKECSCSMVENWTASQETYSYYDGENVQEYDVETCPFYRESELGDSPVKVAEFCGDPDENGYYYASVEATVWLEGFDNEANDILSGGSFNVNLIFDFEKAEAVSAADTTESDTSEETE